MNVCVVRRILYLFPYDLEPSNFIRTHKDAEKGIIQRKFIGNIFYILRLVLFRYYKATNKGNRCQQKYTHTRNRVTRVKKKTIAFFFFHKKAFLYLNITMKKGFITFSYILTLLFEGNNTW